MRASRIELLDTMNKTCSETSRAQWQRQLEITYRKRSISLANPEAFDAKYMDEFLQSSFISKPRPSPAASSALYLNLCLSPRQKGGRGRSLPQGDTRVR